MHGLARVDEPGYHRTSATRRGSTATELRGTPKSATSLRRGGTTTGPINCRATGAQIFNHRRSARGPVRGGATAAHLYPFDRGAASTGPLRACTLLTQLCGRGATATRSQSTERSVAASNLRSRTTGRFRRSTTTTRLRSSGVAAVKLCDRGAAAARPQRRNAVAIQRCAVVMQRGGAAMTQHGSAVVTQLVSAVVKQRGNAGMTPHSSAVVTPCGSAVVTQRGSPTDATELHTRGESESETRLPRGITTTTARSSDVTNLYNGTSADLRRGSTGAAVARLRSVPWVLCYSRAVVQLTNRTHCMIAASA